IGEASAYCEYAGRFTKYLKDMVTANSQTDFWRNVGALFTRTANFIPVYFTSANIRDVYRHRAAIMETTLASLNNPLGHVFCPRSLARSCKQSARWISI